MGGLFNKTREMLQDGPFLKKALMIACPVALQGMLNTIVNMVDTLMIGGLGSTAIAAVGLANKDIFRIFSAGIRNCQWRRHFSCPILGER